MRFHDRAAAGVALIAPVRRRIGHDGAVVVGIPRGGAVVAAALANTLRLPLDILVVRHFGVPQHPSLPMGALARGFVALNLETIEQSAVSRDAVIHVIGREQRELERREALYRRGLPPIALRDQVVVLVDDGSATESTLLVAAHAIRQQSPARIILATPVATKEVVAAIAPEVDDVACLVKLQRLQGLGRVYRDFSQVNDADIVRSLRHNRETSQ